MPILISIKHGILLFYYPKFQTPALKKEKSLSHSFQKLDQIKSDNVVALSGRTKILLQKTSKEANINSNSSVVFQDCFH